MLSVSNLRLSLICLRGECRGGGLAPPPRSKRPLTLLRPWRPHLQVSFSRRRLRPCWHAFEHRLGSAFDQGLGFRQAQAGLDLAHGLDDGNLLVRRHGDQDDVERVLASAAGAAAPPPGAAAATATGAAAETPHLVSSSFTRSAISITVALLSSSTIFALSRAIVTFHCVSSSPMAMDGLSSLPANRRFTLLFV